MRLNRYLDWRLIASIILPLIFLLNGCDSVNPPVESSTTCPPTLLYYQKVYHTVKIEEQCWMKENLDVGVMMSGDKSSTDNDTIDKYCYDEDPSNCNSLGGLYEWDEAMRYSEISGGRGICPPGWHIPTWGDYLILKGAVDEDGRALMEIEEAGGSFDGTNTSGFSALLTGVRDADGSYLSIELYTSIWSSTLEHIVYPSNEGLSRPSNLALYGGGGNIYLQFSDRRIGRSIRCLKNR